MITIKTLLFTCSLSLSYIATFGQVKEIYLDDALKEISRFDFQKEKDRYKTYDLQFDLDTLIVNIKVQRVGKGQISLDKLDSIRTEVSAISGQSIPKDNILIINYYPGLDSCNSTGDKSITRVAYKKFLKKLNKAENVSQFFMYKSAEGIAEYGEQLRWIQDKSGIVEKTFFPIHYPCGSYVLIDPNGNYYVRKGEYNIGEIIDLLNNRETTFEPVLQK